MQRVRPGPHSPCVRRVSRVTSSCGVNVYSKGGKGRGEVFTYDADTPLYNVHGLNVLFLEYKLSKVRYIARHLSKSISDRELYSQKERPTMDGL